MGFRSLGLPMWLALAVCLVCSSACAATGAPLDAEQVRRSEPATVEIWNRPVLTVRAAVGAIEPQARAASIRRRIDALTPADLSMPVRAAPGRIGELQGVWILVGDKTIAGLLPQDVDPESGETLEQLAQSAVAQLSTVLAARAEQGRLPVLLKGAAFSIGATLLFVVALQAVLRARRWLLERSEARVAAEPQMLLGIDVVPLLASLRQVLVKAVSFAVVAFATYLWLAFALLQFPYTEPWGARLGALLRQLFADFGTTVLRAIPDLFMLLVIVQVARLVSGAANRLLLDIETGRLSIGWLYPETAKATRYITVALIWAAAIIIAYPFIPGSHSDVFKGASVLAGLMVSLGSAGIVNHLMSGLVIVYSRALRPGDYVQVQDTEGLVAYVGVLSTKIVTYRQQEITIPNAVLVSNPVINYSRLAGNQGVTIATTVTIGYDAAWRQVHALLQLAAERTPGVRQEPAPRVLQRALSDFYVEYQLLAHLDRPEDRIPALSKLHANIQDAFNEFSVQIMSPHYRSQPHSRVLVPHSEWHAAPAPASARIDSPRKGPRDDSTTGAQA